MSEISYSPARSRRQLSSLYSLFIVSTMMFETRDADDILRLCTTSVPSLGPITADAVYLIENGKVRRTDEPDRFDIDDLIARLGGHDGRVDLEGRAWCWAYPLRTRAGLHGYLILGGGAEPEPDVLFLVRVLVQQTAVAIANAWLYQSALATAADLRSLSDERARINGKLTRSVDEFARRARAQEVLAQASGQDGEDRIAEALSQLIAMPVATEDRFGNITAWSAPDGSEPYCKQPPAKHDAVLHDASKAGGRPMRFGSRLVEVVRPGHEPLGAVVAVDSRRSAGDYELFALQHAATVLAVEWGHQRELAEIKLRLRRDLVDELVSGRAGDIPDAYARASAVGHDLTGSHQVVTIRWDDAAEVAVFQAAEHALAKPGLRPLVARRSGLLVAIARYPVDATALYQAMARELTLAGGCIGVSTAAADPGGLPRAYAESVRALEFRANSRTPFGASDYTELGIYRLLGTGVATREVEGFIDQWLGPLLDYDTRRHSELVQTLATYLNCGGNYNRTAARLTIHRSTLRYRLRRIREMTGHDLSDVETRFNLHVATRIWSVLDHP